MQTSKISALALFATLAAACTSGKPDVQWIASTMDSPWQEMAVPSSAAESSTLIRINPADTDQTVKGFGVSFSELGWQSLGLLSEADRKAVLDELFVPGQGASFNICRTPVGANDFSIDFYSFDETDGDFELKDFSIDRDRQTLIPLIKEALARNPELRIWASPWCPPSWMKYNKHYAMRPDVVNDLPAEGRGYEGQDMFIQEEKYFDAYARYFGKYIDAYRQEGVDLFMVMPQNEPNSDQNFPSCCWTAAGLTRFLRHLCPEMDSRGVEVYFGTWERPKAAAIDTVMTDPEVGKYIKGLAFQWAGRSALPVARESYPDAVLVMSEQECGNGRNDWAGACHSWELMKHYLGNGVQIYDYWNISLIKDGLSHWNWRQNSLVVVDKETGSYDFTIEYYLMKHASHFVQPGARRIRLDYENALAFINPDGFVVLITSNETDQPLDITVQVGVGSAAAGAALTNMAARSKHTVAAAARAASGSWTVTLQPQSFNTFVLK